VTQVCPYLAALPRLELAVRLAFPVFTEPINLPNIRAVVLEDNGNWNQVRSRSNLCNLGGVLPALFGRLGIAGGLLGLGRFVRGGCFDILL